MIIQKGMWTLRLIDILITTEMTNKIVMISQLIDPIEELLMIQGKYKFKKNYKFLVEFYYSLLEMPTLPIKDMICLIIMRETQ